MGRWMDRGKTRRGEGAPVASMDSPADVVSRPTSAARNDQTTKVPARPVDRFRRWRWRNAELLTDDDRRLGHDSGGFCATHHRWLTYPEQQRGACSWCVPVDPDREPEYWASHWRRFRERR